MPFASIKEVYGDDFVVTTQQQQPFIYKSMLNNNEKYSPESINEEVENFVSEYSDKLENYEDLEDLYEE
ncbi:uncharacterized protein METZ01_LOCUS472367, partial [marine metagenome]